MPSSTYAPTGGAIGGGEPWRGRVKFTIPAFSTQRLRDFPYPFAITIGVNKVVDQLFKTTDANGNELPFGLKWFDADRGKVTGYVETNLPATQPVTLYLYYR